MARTCPVTGETVLYTECTGCEDRTVCRTKDVRPVFAMLVVGSRSVTDYPFFKSKMDLLLSRVKDSCRILIVSGGAAGADTLAERYAAENGYALKVMKADWKKGNAAGYIRNREMHRYVSGFEKRGCAAFWDGRSSGTRHSFSLAEEFGTPLRVILCRDGPGRTLPDSGQKT